MRRATALLSFLLLAVPSFCTAATAEFPNRPVRIIVTTSAGGGVDITARTLAQKLTDIWGQTVVVDNRTGASGIIGLELAARAAPDGHTLIMVTAGHAGHAAVQRKLPYDLLRDFAPITEAVTTYYLLAVHPSVPAASVQELIAYARSKPGSLSYGSTGIGQTTHLSWLQFTSLTKINAVHVPYKGGAQALTALVAGEIQLLFANPLESIPQVRNNRIRALAVTSAKRSRAAPELPTLVEAGIPNFEVSGWYGVVAPAATPRPIVAALNTAFVQVLRMPDVAERFAKDGIETVGSTSEQFQQHLRSETERWKRVATAAGLARQ